VHVVYPARLIVAGGGISAVICWWIRFTFCCLTKPSRVEFIGHAGRFATELREGLHMRAHRIMLGFIPGILLTVGTMQASFAEEYRGTMEQQMACTPDVWRLCGDQIPDVNRIVACLQRNTPNLSSGCRAVFESNNSMPPSQAVPPPSRGHVASPPARVVPPPRQNDDDDDDRF
jgi:hypothetical protein